MGSLAPAALLLGLVVVLAGCGSDGPLGDDIARPRDLEGKTVGVSGLTLGGGWGMICRHLGMTCDPVGGTHLEAEKACAALDAHAEALHPVPGDLACAEIYGGDQVAEVTGVTPSTGSLRALFDRTNGCEIARWDALAPLIELPA